MHTIYVTILPHVNSKRKIISHVHNFCLFFVTLKRIRKGSDLTNVFSHQVILTQRPLVLYYVAVFTPCARWMYDVVRAWIMNSVRSRDAQ